VTQSDLLSPSDLDTGTVISKVGGAYIYAKYAKYAPMHILAYSCIFYCISGAYQVHISAYFLHILCIFLHINCIFSAYICISGAYQVHIVAFFLHILCIFHAYSLHISAYKVHIRCIFFAYVCMFSSYSVHILCILSAYSLHIIAYFLNSCAYFWHMIAYSVRIIAYLLHMPALLLRPGFTAPPVPCGPADCRPRSASQAVHPSASCSRTRLVLVNNLIPPCLPILLCHVGFLSH
jgi:hypothetical protein